MTTTHIEVIIHGLEKRKITFDYPERVGSFVRHPMNPEVVQAAQDTFNQLLGEAKSQRDAIIAHGGYFPDTLPAIRIA
jgi:hypothetical protein